MEQFVRHDAEGQAVLDYDELDLAARINFREHVERWASDIEIDFLSEPDASNGERVSAIDDTVNRAMDVALQLLNDASDEEVGIDEDTVETAKEWMARRLADKYDVEL